MGFDVICNGNRECAELIQAKQERDALKAENERIKTQCEYEFTAKNDALSVLWGCEERVGKLMKENAALDESLKTAVELNEQYAMQNAELRERLEKAEAENRHLLRMTNMACEILADSKEQEVQRDGTADKLR